MFGLFILFFIPIVKNKDFKRNQIYQIDVIHFIKDHIVSN